MCEQTVWSVALSENPIRDDMDSSAGKGCGVLSYFKEIAAAVGLVAENGINVLDRQYQRLTRVRNDTVLAKYLAPSRFSEKHVEIPFAIYPFGINQSQKKAVERALSSSVSIVQGPPGTGKTQTILNIIANVVRSEKTVAVVSNNNSATHNVLEKLEKSNVSFLAAFLGNSANKKKFVEEQTGRYPDMREWSIRAEEVRELERDTRRLSIELDEMFNVRNRLAEIEQEFIQLDPEQHYFEEYYATCPLGTLEGLKSLSADRILSFMVEYEQHVEGRRLFRLFWTISVFFRFGYRAWKLSKKPSEQVIPHLQYLFYCARRKGLERERAHVQNLLKEYSFTSKVDELTRKSLRLFRAGLSKRYLWRGKRPEFTAFDFRCRSSAVTKEYPIVLSTTHAIRSTLNDNYVYDYLIVDESSQVDLVTGVLAFSCARNVVIVGDLAQLPNVLSGEAVRMCNDIWLKYALTERFCCMRQNLLSSALKTWPNAPITLLREHYRCHPKIIGFCNQKFYGGKLVVMTKDKGETDVLAIYRTVEGNHARGHMNQRQIDVIRQEVLPRLLGKSYKTIGIIAPYRDQVTAIRDQIGEGCEVDTIHKFKGRERDAIVLSSVDNVIGGFVDDSHMLNVAVSRAVHSLTVVMSKDSRNEGTNYEDLARYVEYNNLKIVQSRVYSVFDLLYRGYAEQRAAYLKKKRRISEYDSENLMFSEIQKMLDMDEFSSVGCAVHVSLSTLVRDLSPLTEDECRYVNTRLSHVDFLLFKKIGKLPLLAIEVDGTHFHEAGSAQALRDAKKNSIMEKCGLRLLRFRTDGSCEREKIIAATRMALSAQW